MSKKRTSLDSIFAESTGYVGSGPFAASSRESRGQAAWKVKQQTAYLPDKVHEQLRHLAFEERGKMHDYLMEGLDLVSRRAVCRQSVNCWPDRARGGNLQEKVRVYHRTAIPAYTLHSNSTMSLIAYQGVCPHEIRMR